jgi:hypothetical protein
VPPADGSPIDELFTVSPDHSAATVYTAEIPADESEPVVENNARSVLVSPAGHKRRLLVIEGAPGFEHSFMTRAWAADTELEVDSVTRKGKNAEGQDTFLVQASAGRAATLTVGLPPRREQLYAYDGIVIANVEADFLTRAQLAMLSDFVGERGGGLLVLGGRSMGGRWWTRSGPRKAAIGISWWSIQPIACSTSFIRPEKASPAGNAPVPPSLT